MKIFTGILTAAHSLNRLRVSKILPTGFAARMLMMVVLCLGVGKSWGQVSITTLGTALTQNFDGMGASGTTFPANWTGIRVAGSGTVGATLTPVVDNGNSNAGNVFNLGTTSAAERALGTLSSGATVPAFGVSFSNNTGSTINSISLSGVMEQWRSGSSNAVTERVKFEYSTDATSLSTGTWTALTGMDLVEKLTTTTTAAAVDGNLAANQTAISGTITGLNIVNATGKIWLRWTDTDDAGSDGTYGIDNFSLTANSATPTITGAATATAFTTTYGTASTPQTFAVSGSSLTANLVATAPAGFEVSSDGATYGTTATFTQTAGTASGSLRIRLAATAPVLGAYNGQNIVLSSTGATSVNIVTAATGNLVNPKALSVAAPTVTKVYDGTTTAGTVTVGSLTGFVGTETVTATGAATAYSSANAGNSYSATVSYTLANGANGGLASNYSLANSVISNASITAKPLSITDPTVTKVYDGTTAAGTVTVGTLTGFVGTETVTASGTATAYSAASVGSSYNVTVSYVLANGTNGGLANNYSLGSTAISNAAITQRSLTITANDVSKNEGDVLNNGSSSAFTSSGLQNSETIGTVTLTYGVSGTAGAPAGVYPGDVTPSAATGGTFTASNYNISYVAGTVTVISNTTPVCPSSTAVAPAATQTLCQDIAANQLTATITTSGVSGSPTFLYQWYYNTTNSNTVAGATLISGATSATYTPLTSASEVGDRYYFCVGYSTDNTCGQSNSAQSLASNTVRVLVNPTPVEPTGAASQSFCSGANPTVANLAATGNGIQWYDAATAGNLLAGGTALIDGTHYFASQTVNGCESVNRLDVTVTINPTPAAPTGTTPQLFCSTTSHTVADLSATGSGIQWYDAATNGNLLAGSTTLINGTHYYARQTVSGCQSPSLDVVATVTITPGAPTGSASQSFCAIANPTVASLSASGANIEWYDAASGGNLLPGSTALADATHYYAQQTLNGCVGTARLDVTVTINPTPAAPTGAASQSFCSGTNPTVANLTATGSSIKWYDAASGGSLLPGATALVNGTHYFASQTVNGCESTDRFDVTATINPTPGAPTGTAAQTFCAGSTVASLTASGTSIQWYTAATGGSLLSGATALTNGTHYFASQTVNGCESTSRFDVTATVLSAVNYGTLTTTASVNHLVISQVYGGGGNVGATYQNDFIEIYNPTNSTVSLSGWSVQQAAPTGTSWGVTSLSGSVAAKSYYLVQGQSGGANGAALPAADATGTFNMGVGGSKVLLANTTTAFSGSCPIPSASIIDFVGFGNANCSEGSSAAAAHANTTADIRLNNGCTDTDVNSADFSVGTPTPRNSSSASNTCAGPANVTICSGSVPASMSVSGASGGSGTFTYQWYSKSGNACPSGTDITGWTALGSGDGTGFNTSTFTPSVAISSNTSFACFVTPAGSPVCGVPTWASGCRQITVNSVTGGTIAGDQAICSGGDPVVFTESAASTGTGTVTYQWQSSTVSDFSSAVTSISGATSATYDVPAGLSVTTYFRRVTTSAFNGIACTSNSNILTVTVNPLPTASWAAASASVCSSVNSQSTTLAYTSTTGSPTTYSITWNASPANSFVNVTNASNTFVAGAGSINISVPANTAAGTYTGTITVKNNNGCVSSAVQTFTVTVNDAPPTTTGATVCQGGSGLLTASATCSTITGNIQTATGSGGTSEATAYGGSGNTNISISFPSLPVGATITNIATTISYTSNSPSFRSELRVRATPPVTLGAAQSDLQPSAVNSSGSVSNTAFGSWGTGSPVGSWLFEFRETTNDALVNPDANITNITITVTYSLAGVINWYTVSSGGTPIGSGSPFNPVGVLNSGLANTNTPGTTVFYAACSANSTCRTATNFVINETPVITTAPTSTTVCSGGSSAGFNVTATGSSLTYQWQVSTDGVSYSNISGGVYSGETTASLAIANTTGLNGNRYRVIVGGASPCSSVTSDGTAVLRIENIWLTTGTSDWGTASNWSCALVPSAFDNIVIPSGGTQPVLSGNISIQNLSLAGDITLNGNTLTINGSITGAGTLTGSSTSNLVIGGTAGTLNFASGSRTLKNLTLNTGATASLGTSLEIAAGASANTEGAVTVASGATLTTGGNLTLKSDANGTARIATSAGTISGAVTVERYVTTGFSGNRAWRFLSVPVKGQTFHAGWQENQPAGVDGNPGYGTNITSNVANATTAPTPGFDFATPGSSLLTWDVASGTWQGGTSNALVNATSNTSETTAGWLLYIRGDRSVTPSTSIGGATTTTLRTKGDIYQGSQAAISVAADKTVPVGNIFASAIDFTTSGLRSAGIDDAFYVWDPKLQGTYGLGAFQTFASANSWEPVPGGGSYGTAANTIIQSGQAFFVHGATGGAGGSITLTEAAKTAGSAVVQTQASLLERLKTSLYATGSNTQLADGNTVVFNNTYANAVDGNDAVKLNNFGEKLAVIRDSKLLALETRQAIIVTDTVYFNMQNLKQQGYRLVFNADNLDHPGLLGKLIDNYTGTSSVVMLSGESTYDFTVNADAGSSAANRFKVVFYSAGPLPVSFTEIKAYAQGKNVAVEWKVSNQLNIEKYEVERSTDGSSFSKQGLVAATGNNNGGSAAYNWLDVNPVSGYNYYRVRSIGTAGDIKYSSIVQVKMGSMDQSITIYPNPVTNNIVGVQFSNMAKGTYSLRLITASGQTVHTQQYKHTGGTVTVSVDPAVKLAKGVYYLEILQPDNSKLTKTITIAD